MYAAFCVTKVSQCYFGNWIKKVAVETINLASVRPKDGGFHPVGFHSFLAEMVCQIVKVFQNDRALSIG